MTKARQTALEYQRTPPDSLWKWNDSGLEITWHDGTTIAFREEVNAIVTRLAARRLPRFTAIVFLLAACRGKYPRPEASAAMTGADETKRQFVEILRNQNNSLAFGELEKVSRLPDALIRTLEGKTLLAETVFENCMDVTPLAAAEIAEGIFGDWNDDELNERIPGAESDDLPRLIWTLAEGLKPHSADSLTRRLRYGLDQLPKASSAIDLPAQEVARRFLTAISGDAEYSGLAQLARDLMAAIRLPTKIADKDELVLGGSSGLGNRGTLDRLLLSELAHDDITLATRLAMNEALYLHRDPPALKPDRALAILIDVGIRMWGVPRVIATSAAMGLVAGHKGSGSVEVWRTKNGSLVNADLFSMTGLESHLAVLQTDLDPRRAITETAVRLAEKKGSNFVLITHRDALETVSFQSSLAALSLENAFLLVLDNDGNVQLHRMPWGTPRPLAETRIDVTRLFEQPHESTKRPTVTGSDLQDGFPAIFRRRPFPLLLPINSEINLAAKTANGGICVLDAKRLMKWENGPFGAEELLTDLPSGATNWLGCDPKGRIIIVKGRHGDGKMSVVILPPDSLDPFVTQFTGPRAPQAVMIDHDVLLVMLHTRVVVVALDTGELLSETPFPPDASWISGRYFSVGVRVSFAFWNGSSVQWDDAVSGRSILRSEIALAFDRQGVGAWILKRDGQVLAPTGDELMKVGFPVAHAEVRSGGDTLVLVNGSTKKYHQVDLTKKTIHSLKSARLGSKAAEVSPPTRPLQTRFRGIHGGPGRPLRLIKPKGLWLELTVSDQAIRLAESSEKKEILNAEMLGFSPCRNPVRAGGTLQVATWPNGSKAWLDSRGLLHLKSCDSEVPELTITLNQANVAVWTSDGKMCGAPFFLGPNDDAGIGHAANALKAFTDHL